MIGNLEHDKLSPLSTMALGLFYTPFMIMLTIFPAWGIWAIGYFIFKVDLNMMGIAAILAVIGSIAAVRFTERKTV